MTALGFCEDAALSRYTRRLPESGRSCSRMGKSGLTSSARVVAAVTGDADARARVDVVTPNPGRPRAARFPRAELRAWLGAAVANARADIALPGSWDDRDAGNGSRETEPRVPSTSRA